MIKMMTKLKFATLLLVFTVSAKAQSPITADFSLQSAIDYAL